MTSPPTDPMLDRLVDGRYRVVSRIARGGMATVYVANDLRLDRRVAIKIMHGHLADDEAFRDRFVQEARAAARLAHPNVVSVFDQGQEGETAYLVMEYLPGMTLRDLLKDYGRLTTEQTLDIMEAVLGGLAAAHKAGIVHRDVKPENVLLADDGRIKIGDFGLARAATANTATGKALLGTIAYLSPELLTRGVADARSDIYASGIMMYEMLVGEQPYRGEQPMQIAFQHANDTVPAPSAKNPSVAPEVDALVVWATSRDPDDRPHDAKVLLDELIDAEAAVSASIAATAALLRTSVLPPEGLADRRAVNPPSAGRGFDDAGFDDAGVDNAAYDDGETEVLRPKKPRGFARGRSRAAAAAAAAAAAGGAAVAGGAGRGAAAGAGGAGAAGGVSAGAAGAGAAGVGTAGLGAAAGTSSPATALGAPASSAARVAPGVAPAAQAAPGAATPATTPYSDLTVAYDGGAPTAATTAYAAGAPAAAHARTGILDPEQAAPPASAAPAARPDNPVDALATRARRRRKRGWWIFALVLVLVAAGGGTGWYFSAGPGGQLTVPNVATLAPDDAKAQLQAVGLNPIDSQANSPTVAAGTVIGTDPSGGAIVSNGSTVAVITSLGPAQLAIPTLVGLTEAAASQAATDAQFTVAPSRSQFDGTVAKGVVIDALGADGQSLTQKQTYGDQQPVTFVVSLGSVPKVEGMSASDANAALVAVGLTSTVGSTDYSESVASGDVISADGPVDTATGQPANPVVASNQVTLHVSKGPAPVPVPDVSGQSWSKAKAALQAAGFTLAYNQLADLAPDAFSVRATDPAAGTVLPRGSTVTVSFSGF